MNLSECLLQLKISKPPLLKFMVFFRGSAMRELQATHMKVTSDLQARVRELESGKRALQQQFHGDLLAFDGEVRAKSAEYEAQIAALKDKIKVGSFLLSKEAHMKVSGEYSRGAQRQNQGRSAGGIFCWARRYT